MIAELSWLPTRATWDDDLNAARSLGDERERWDALRRLANCNISFVQAGKLDRVLQRSFSVALRKSLGLKEVRLALLGSSTLKHLIAGIRISALRRGIWLEVYEGSYGQYRQELLDQASSLHDFRPDFVCLSLDAPHLYETSAGIAIVALDGMRKYWNDAKSKFSCTVIQQTALPVFPDVLGNNEHRLLDSPQSFIRQLNAMLQEAADESGIHLLSVDKYALSTGLMIWHDEALWHRSKQEIHPAVSNLYGDYLMRVIAAQLGRSAKCLVLDLDNTLWGGVIGDDGMDGIILGHGDSLAESFLAFQRYILRLKERGIILAVCSKNDESNALAVFEQHPEMLLRRTDIACFVANWRDKAENLRHIAKTLNIGLDALVFVDDNPFERGLVREALPEVVVPELPDDPALYVRCLASAGYFEGLTVTEEDRARAAQYQANAEREVLRESATDMTSYLRGLRMEMFWQPFDELNLHRIVQLINKTNQFNLTTKRYSQAQVRATMASEKVLTLQMRLKDKFGDNGIIGILIGKLNLAFELEIDTWLMSCRVLGREVEVACFNLLVGLAKELGAVSLIGVYYPTAKNSMVSDLYARLGFSPAGTGEAGSTRWVYSLASLNLRETQIQIVEERCAGH